MQTILNEYYNQQGNYVVRVCQHTKGFSISLFDLDALQNVSAHKIFSNLLEAQQYARFISNN